MIEEMLNSLRLPINYWVAQIFATRLSTSNAIQRSSSLPLSSRAVVWFIGKIIASVVVTLLIVFATLHILGKNWNELGAGELFALLLMYGIIAGALSFVFVFFLRHGLSSRSPEVQQ